MSVNTIRFVALYTRPGGSQSTHKDKLHPYSMMNGFPSEELPRDSGGEVTSPTAAIPAVPLGPLNGQVCCLRDEGERCTRPAGNASFSKRIQKSISQKKVKIDLDKTYEMWQAAPMREKNMSSDPRVGRGGGRRRMRRGGRDTDGGGGRCHRGSSRALKMTRRLCRARRMRRLSSRAPRTRRLCSKEVRPCKARHLYICDFHKNLIQSVRNRRKRKGSDDDEGDSPVHDTDTPEVDLFQLQVNTLRRYKRHFKLQARPGLNKAQLVEIIGGHFRTLPVNEKDTLTYFICSVKNEKNKADHKSDGGLH